VQQTAVVGLPIYTLAKYSGMGRAPDALRKAGLVDVLGRNVREEGDAPVPVLDRDVLAGRTKNLEHFVRATDNIITKLRGIGKADLLVCVGGECSSTVGVLAGLKGIQKGNPGMVWIDTHGDFNTPETSPSGYVGGMCLAMACGRGPTLGDNVEALRPLLEEERLVHVGSRALDPPEVEMMRSSPMGLFTMKKVTLTGISKLADTVARTLEDSSDWIVCHLDVDVLDPSVVRAVNYPTPGGMGTDDVVAIVKRLARTGKLKVLEVCAYNADLDSDGSSAKAIIGIVKRALA
jgi:arginase